MRLIALKPFTYATRRLRPGQDFEAPDMQAKVLCAIRKAEPARDRATLAPIPAELAAKVKAANAAAAPEDERRALRAAYEKATGRRAFSGWDADTLRAKIADAAKGSHA